MKGMSGLSLTTDVWTSASDNASNMVNCATILKTPHVRCFARSLQLVINGALKETTVAAKVLVSYYWRSVLASSELQKRKKQMDVPNNGAPVIC